MTGLREQQRRRQHDAISAAAIALFLERGFDQVPVTEIAAAAGVSKPTLFKYFPTKEDLVLHRIADHQHESARVVAAAGGDPVEALHAHFQQGLRRNDPVTGLNDTPEVMAFHRMVFDTPSLAARLHHYMAEAERALADALAAVMPDASGRLAAELLAAHVQATLRVLARRNHQALAAGRPLARVAAEASAEAERAFAVLRLP